MLPCAQAGRRGGVPGVQPDLLAERPLEADEGRPRARRCPRAAQVQRRRVPGAPWRLQRRAPRAGAVPGDLAAARRLERRSVQQAVRRHLQRAAPVARPAVRLAPAGVLSEVAWASMLPFIKSQAYGNDFLLVEQNGLGEREPAALARAMC